MYIYNIIIKYNILNIIFIVYMCINKLDKMALY